MNKEGKIAGGAIAGGAVATAAGAVIARNIFGERANNDINTALSHVRCAEALGALVADEEYPLDKVDCDSRWLVSEHSGDSSFNQSIVVTGTGEVRQTETTITSFRSLEGIVDAANVELVEARDRKEDLHTDGMIVGAASGAGIALIAVMGSFGLYSRAKRGRSGKHLQSSASRHKVRVSGSDTDTRTDS